ncbi:YcjF family protein [Ahrensia kielensis]|uniref:YcjF family protein n=1 Tax=Ahrensia kielensis TaxID=76980 RepID=UPI000379633C|nr:TIGR01620 family protein [Ahrensia kielensis]
MSKQPSDSRKPRAFSVPAEDNQASNPDVEKAKPKPRKPRSIPASPTLNYEKTDEAFFAAEERGELDALAPPPPQKRLRKSRIKFGTLATAALGFLISASLGLWLENLISDLAAQNLWLGRAAMLAAALFVLGVLAFIIRELRGIWKIRSVSKLRERIEVALSENKPKEINNVTKELESHFEGHPKTAHGRSILKANKNEVMDAQDRYALTERELLAGLDREARQIVMNSAKRVSVVTAVSPRAIVDIGYVLYENIRLIRVMCEHYGGRSGLVGTFSLLRRVVAHLAVTGSIAIGDGIIQQLLGHGLAAKLSARLGEGVINGLMTARVGLSAIDVCRPAPFHALERPKISDFAANLTSMSNLKPQQNEPNK